jgi:hypothetical protein
MTAAKKPFQILMLALASVAGLFVVTHWVRSTASGSGSVVEAITRERPVKNVAEASDLKLAESRDINLALPQRSRVAPDSKGEAFAKLSWLPPPPPPRVAPPPTAALHFCGTDRERLREPTGLPIQGRRATCRRSG